MEIIHFLDEQNLQKEQIKCRSVSLSSSFLPLCVSLQVKMNVFFLLFASGCFREDAKRKLWKCPNQNTDWKQYCKCVYMFVCYVPILP